MILYRCHQLHSGALGDIAINTFRCQSPLVHQFGYAYRILTQDLRLVSTQMNHNQYYTSLDYRASLALNAIDPERYGEFKTLYLRVKVLMIILSRFIVRGPSAVQFGSSLHSTSAYTGHVPRRC